MSWVAEYAALFNMECNVDNEEDFFLQLNMLQLGMKKKIER